MSDQRAGILRRLEAHHEPVGVSALVAATGLHGNTVRSHLDALIEAGLVDREKGPAVGRGRPPWLYRTTDRSAAAEPDRPADEYAGLAAALAGQIARTSRVPAQHALEAGRRWGRELVRQDTDERAATAANGRRRVVDLLDELGFAPEANTRVTQVRLTQCPLLAAAHRFPDVVCGVHLGIVQGALEEQGVPAEQVRRTSLSPFAEPGACRLRLLTREVPERALSA